MAREEHIASIIRVVWDQIGVNLLPVGETALLLMIWTILDAAIEDEVRLSSTYRQLQEVSVN
jgi:hypothetical protein